MPRENRIYDFEVESVKISGSDFLGVTINYGINQNLNKGIGMPYFFRVKKEDYDLFVPGTKYNGVFEISGMPDFVGEADKWENVCTITSTLEKVLKDEIIVWERERKK